MYVRIPAKRGITCASSWRYGGPATERIYSVAFRRAWAASIPGLRTSTRRRQTVSSSPPVLALWTRRVAWSRRATSRRRQHARWRISSTRSPPPGAARSRSSRRRSTSSRQRGLTSCVSGTSWLNGLDVRRARCSGSRFSAIPTSSSRSRRSRQSARPERLLPFPHNPSSSLGPVGSSHMGSHGPCACDHMHRRTHAACTGVRMHTRLLGTCLAALAAALALGAPAGAATYARGLDVSHWNGSIDWIQVAGDGYTFLFAKATEGTTFSDVTYPINRAGTQGLGLRVGAYHFARPAGTNQASITASAIAQADHFADFAQPAAGDLPPALDLEARGGLSPANLVQWTQAWLDEVAARTGVHALIYASSNFWKTSLADTTAFAGNGNPLWIAHWTTNAAPLVPASNWGGLGWTFWQWTKCTQAAGFANCSDGDRANGPSPAPFAIKPYPAGAPAPNTPPTIVGT